MAPLIPYLIAVLAGGAAFAAGRKSANASPTLPGPPNAIFASDPVGFRRLSVGDRITAKMVLAQRNDITLPYGVHHYHQDGDLEFFTAVENPSGLQKIVTVFVPLYTR